MASEILIISDDVVGEKMAGPGIRAWEIAKCLSRHFRVTLAIPDYSYLSGLNWFFTGLDFDVLRYSVQKPASLQSAAAECRVILIQGYILSKFPFLKETAAYRIVDIYVPFVLENLFVHQWKVPNIKDREYIHLNDLRVLNDQLIWGDHFLCANARQKDLFLGSLMSLNRINPRMLDSSPSLDDLISIVPFGIARDDLNITLQSTGRTADLAAAETAAAAAGPRILKGIRPGIGPDDILLLWGGVLTNWFDPVTLIRAVHGALDENPRLRLFFLSTKHPNPLLPELDAARDAVREAEALGIKDSAVFFNESWVDYNDRSRYLREADIGVSIHKTHFETWYSFRTRILDYLKYRLPVICTEGDYFAELIEREKLGFVVRSEDVVGLKAAILRLAGDIDLRQEIQRRSFRVRRQFLWERVIEPLVRHCRRVLAGEAARVSRPDKRELAYISGSKEDSALARNGKRRFWVLFQKMPAALSARLRRLLRFLR